MNGSVFLRHAALFAVGGGLSILVAEAVLHTVEATPAWRVLPVIERILGAPHHELGYALRPNHTIINVKEHRAVVSTNSFGLRDVEIALKKSPKVVRIALTGDSITEALQVDGDQIFDAYAERLLNADGEEDRYEILNLAMSGAGPLRQLFQLKILGLQFEPDMAVAVISIQDFVSGDMLGDSQNPGYVVADDGEIYIGFDFRKSRSQRHMNTPIGRIFFWILDNSRIAVALYKRQRKGIWTLDFGAPNQQVEEKSRCDRLSERIEGQLALWRDGEPALRARLLDRYLHDMNELLRTNELKGAIMFRNIGYPGDDCASVMAPRRELVDIVGQRLAEFDIQFIDIDGFLAGRFGSPTEAHKVYGFGRRVGSGHLNLFGHSIYAELLAQTILAAEP